MQAEKLILETDNNGYLMQQPKLPANARLEAIFLVLEELSPKLVVWDEERTPTFSSRGLRWGSFLTPTYGF